MKTKKHIAVAALPMRGKPMSEIRAHLKKEGFTDEQISSFEAMAKMHPLAFPQPAKAAPVAATPVKIAQVAKSDAKPAAAQPVKPEAKPAPWRVSQARITRAEFDKLSPAEKREFSVKHGGRIDEATKPDAAWKPSRPTMSRAEFQALSPYERSLFVLKHNGTLTK